MNVEPLLLPPGLPIVEYCRAVTAAASINEIRLSLREYLTGRFDLDLKEDEGNRRSQETGERPVA